MCARCDAPNPRPLSEDDWLNLLSYYGKMQGYPFSTGLRAAVEARKQKVGAE